MCWTCNLHGHISRNCPQKGTITPEAPASTGVANRGSERKKKDLTLDKSNVYITLVLAGKKIPCLLDSGCEATMVLRSILTHRQIVNMTPTSRKVYAANDTPIQVEGELQLPCFLGEQCIWTDALVSEDIEEVMLGIDWLTQNDCVWDFRTRKLSIMKRPTVHSFIHY